MVEQVQAAAAVAGLADRLNWLRAGVLGANDGIVSTAALIFGIAGAAASQSTIVLAGVAAIAAGAMSMAVGEYVSVSSQRDVEEAELRRERAEIAADPQAELLELVGLLEQRGIAPGLAAEVAEQLTRKDALAAHSRLELGLEPGAVVNPWRAALASMVAFTLGGLVPLIAILLSPRSIEIWITGVAVLVALGVSGAISAWLGRTAMLPSVARMLIGGLAAMVITYGIGTLAGTPI